MGEFSSYWAVCGFGDVALLKRAPQSVSRSCFSHMAHYFFMMKI